jgi:hypothetical protein
MIKYLSAHDSLLTGHPFLPSYLGYAGIENRPNMAKKKFLTPESMGVRKKFSSW